MLVNLGEVETDAVLREAVGELGARVFAKPRLADVLNIDRSGLSKDEFSYALKAHLDFVIASESDGTPHFAVEFDGPYHSTSPNARRRDTMKDSICDQLGLPLLRVDADFLRTVKGFRLVAWLTELWFVYDGFVKAQESGYIAWDEPFDTGSVVEHDEKGRWIHPYDLADNARRTVRQACEDGRIQDFTPNYLYRSRDEYGEAYALLKVDDDRWLTSYARIRAFHFPPVTPGGLAADLAVVDVVDKLAEYERGAAVAAGYEQYKAIAGKINGRNGLRDGWSWAWSSG
jgi:hypothetical protein